MIIEPGSTLLHYRLIRRLGSGGAGEVFEAEDSRLERRVAVKIIHPEVAARPDSVERFRREARALASLDHPGIVTLHAIEELEGRLFLVMERIEGSTLAELIPEGGFEPGRLFELTLHLTDAVAAAHDHGIVHRDLKPGNVMVRPDGGLKILDFGLARLVVPEDSRLPTLAARDPLTESGVALGTWHYMAPEQIRGEIADARSDVFALGVVLYEMACGYRPFPGATVVDVAHAIFKLEPASLGQARQDLPNSFADTVHWCLEKDRKGRPADARVVHDALSGLLRAGERDSGAPVVRAGPDRGVAGRDRSPAASDRRVADRDRRAAPLPRPTAAQARPAPSRAGRRLVGLAAVLASLLLAAALIYRFQPPPSAPTAIAVLPFANLTGDPAVNHLARGIPAGLITRLAEVSDLQVLSRSESWHLADETLPAALLAERLGVASLVEGELHADGGDLRAEVRLSDGPSGLVVWSGRFSGREDALFELQHTIAAGLVRVLAVPLSSAERRRMARDPTSSLAAYSSYLKGEQSLADATNPQRTAIAAHLFRDSLRRDPEFAPAHAGLAEALVQLHEQRPEAETLEEADRHVHRALELDPELGLARVALARVARAYGRPASAIEELQQVIPALAAPEEAYRELAAAYEQMGDLVHAERALLLAVSSGEESWLSWNRLGALYLRGGSYDEARRALQRAAELAPEGIHWPQLNLATLELFQANWQAAVDAFEAAEAPASDPRLAANLGTAYFFLGRLDDAEAQFRRAVRLDPEDHQARRNLGDLLLRQGDVGAARSAFRSALELVEKRLTQTPGDAQLRVFQAVYAAKAELCPQALATARDLELEREPVGEDARRLAQAYALCGAIDDALAVLEAGLESGLSPQFLREEDEFEALRDDPRFLRLVAQEDPTPNPR